MRNLTKNIIAFIFSFILIYSCLILGHYISSVLPIVFPGSIIGLIILFLCLELKIIKMEWITPAGNLILKHMAFFFIPAAVGLVSYLNEVYNSAIVIVINVILGLCAIIFCVGRLFQHMSETPKQRKHRKDMYKRAKRIKRVHHKKLKALKLPKELKE